MFGLCAALSIQLIAGFIGYAQQSTAFLDLLNMKWPGVLDPSMRGASVVQLANGLRVLRAYGTLPHPNILGGLVFITLLGPISLFLANKKPNYPALILLCLGIILISLTFSRSAWLALISFAGILILKSKYFERKAFSLNIHNRVDDHSHALSIKRPGLHSRQQFSNCNRAKFDTWTIMVYTASH
jgi:hypothetical protein